MSNSTLRLPHPPSAVRVSDGDGQAALDRVVAIAREEGYRAGLSEGRQPGRDTASEALDRAAEELRALREELIEQAARDAAALATEIAAHLLHKEIDEGRYDIERIVREVLRESGVGRDACSVHLHPTDVASLEGVKFRSGTAIEEDIAIARGNVQIEAPRGLMVHDVDGAVRSIRERILADLQ